MKSGLMGFSIMTDEIAVKSLRGVIDDEVVNYIETELKRRKNAILIADKMNDDLTNILMRLDRELRAYEVKDKVGFPTMWRC